jgi:hypothetical protein
MRRPRLIAFQGHAAGVAGSVVEVVMNSFDNDAIVIVMPSHVTGTLVEVTLLVGLGESAV